LELPYSNNGRKNKMINDYPFVDVDFREWKIMPILIDIGYPIDKMIKQQNTWGDFEGIRYDTNGKKIIFVIVERKTIRDAFYSMRTGHWDDQLERGSHYCREHQIPYILAISDNLTDFVEEERSRQRFNMNETSIVGGIASAAIRYGIHVVWIEDKKEMLKVIFKMIRKIYEGKLFKQKRIIIRGYKGYPQNVLRLHRLCGISLKLSDQLIKKCGNIKGVLLATDEELLGIKGLGKKTLQQFRQVLG